ncbi:MAG: hypothetical protein CME04_13515 [Gemmatimonadaceae bacterium]|nr:hypothetical protein [Gemmatimonadaceae bacterium]
MNMAEADNRANSTAATEYRYNRLSWPELDEAIGLQKVVLLPTGSTEQHGRHLPLDVDVFLSEEVCLEIGRRAPDRVLVLPPVAYTLSPRSSSRSASTSPSRWPTTVLRRCSSSTATAPTSP